MKRAVLVTGASRGLGRATAAAFAALGDRVAIHHRASDALAESLRASLPGQGHVVVTADLADPDGVRGLVDEAVEPEFPRLVREGADQDTAVNVDILVDVPRAS
jgi:NAD(P)-dependent dehydrogenase (short-subunit alcohol dehydrogenase family)